MLYPSRIYVKNNFRKSLEPRQHASGISITLRGTPHMWPFREKKSSDAISWNGIDLKGDVKSNSFPWPGAGVSWSQHPAPGLNSDTRGRSYSVGGNPESNIRARHGFVLRNRGGFRCREEKLTSVHQVSARRPGSLSAGNVIETYGPIINHLFLAS